MLVVAGILAALGVLLRQQGVPRLRTIWAEDGAVFVQCALDDPAWRCLTAPYDAWLLTVPRILAAIATVFDPSTWSYGLTALAALITAGAAILVARAVADASESGWAGLLAGASLALVYPAGGEVGGNLTNLHWILLAAGVAVTVSTWIGHRFDAADGVLIVLLGSSSPFGALIVAFALIGAILRRPRMQAVTLLAGSLALIQLGVAAIAPRIEVPDAAASPASPFGLYLDTVVRSGIFGPRGWVPDQLVTIGALVSIVGLLVLALRGIGSGRPHSLTVDVARFLDVMAIGALLSAGIAVFAASLLLNNHVASRHIYVAAELTRTSSAICPVPRAIPCSTTARTWLLHVVGCSQNST